MRLFTGPQLKVVATMSAGFDHIDARFIKEKGILFGNTPRVLDDAVADIGVALVLDVSRRLQEGRRVIERYAHYKMQLPFPSCTPTN